MVYKGNPNQTPGIKGAQAQQLETGIIPGQPYMQPAAPTANATGQYPAPLSKKPQRPPIIPTKPGGVPGNPVGPAGGPDNRPSPRRRTAIQRYLAGDDVFADQKAALDRNAEQYRLANFDSRKDIRQDFGTAVRNMNTQRDRDLESMVEDFAARGIVNSGTYGQQVGKYDTDYQRSMTDLTTDRDRNITELLRQLTQFRGNVRDQRMSARNEAIRRRAIELGLT